MIEQQRFQMILQRLNSRKLMSIHEAVELTGASEATLRRDFNRLEEEGKILRVRGGISLPGGESGLPTELSHNERTVINTKKKQRIARAACELLQSGDSIIIDGGSTTYQMSQYLVTDRYRVFTNSFAIASFLIANSDCEVTVPEGIVDPKSLLILNPINSDPFSNYRASKVFMGVEGITTDVLTNSDALLIKTEKNMIEKGEQLVILADESKFGRLGHLTLAPTNRASIIITTTDADQAIIDELRLKEITVIQV